MAETHVLRLTWGTSRGRDTYGYTICTLTDETTGKRFRCMGGGYDMAGTVFAEWLEATFPEELAGLSKYAADFYGMSVRRDGTVRLDGACGLESMLTVAKALNVNVTRTHDRKGNTTGWLVSRDES